MNWQEVLKTNLEEQISWPNELIGVYDSQNKKRILVVEKSEIPSYINREGWEEIKLTYDAGEYDGKAKYSYDDWGNSVGVTKKQAVMNALGKQEWERLTTHPSNIGPHQFKGKVDNTRPINYIDEWKKRTGRQ